jgi:hypothetical protein
MSPIRSPSPRCSGVPRPNVASELRPALEPVDTRAHLRPSDEPMPQHLGFVHSRFGLGRVTRQQQPRAEEGQGRRHDQPAAPAPQLRRVAADPTSECCVHGGCERVDESRDRQARQIDFPGLHHLQQPVERSLETIDRENRRRSRRSRARRILPGGISATSSADSPASRTMSFTTARRTSDICRNAALASAQPVLSGRATGSSRPTKR